jgi:hypothetical protein
MNPLNDDELTSLLQQAKSKPPEPSPDLAARALRSYRGNVVKPPNWRLFLLRPVSIPLPLGMLAAVLLILLGAAVGLSFRRPSVIVQSHSPEVSATREHVVYRDCPAVQPASQPPIASLTFKEFQPVRQIKPRVVRSTRDDQ